MRSVCLLSVSVGLSVPASGSLTRRGYRTCAAGSSESELPPVDKTPRLVTTVRSSDQHRDKRGAGLVPLGCTIVGREIFFQRPACYRICRCQCSSGFCANRARRGLMLL